MDVFEMVDISLSDKGKADILEKFGEYTPESIKKYFMENGQSETEAAAASNIINNAAKAESRLKGAFPWISIGVVAGIFLIRAMGKR